MNDVYTYIACLLHTVSTNLLLVLGRLAGVRNFRSLCDFEPFSRSPSESSWGLLTRLLEVELSICLGECGNSVMKL